MSVTVVMLICHRWANYTTVCNRITNYQLQCSRVIKLQITTVTRVKLQNYKLVISNNCKLQITSQTLICCKYAVWYLHGGMVSCLGQNNHRQLLNGRLKNGSPCAIGPLSVCPVSL